MKGEIFKCRQQHLSKKGHFIVISGEEERRGRRLLGEKLQGEM